MVSWIEAQIFTEPDRRQEILLSFIRPLVEKIRSQFNIISYHFFRYSDTRGYYLRFRVLTNDEFIEQIKGLINEAEKLKEVTKVYYPEKPYEGEKESFGEDGWKSTYKFLEAGSEVALDKYDDNVRKGNYFNESYFVHLFLNQIGYHYLREAQFHALTTIERIEVIRQTEIEVRDFRINELEERIKQLEERA